LGSSGLYRTPHWPEADADGRVWREGVLKLDGGGNLRQGVKDLYSRVSDA